MILKTWFKGYVLITSVVLIGVLLLANIYLIYQNSFIIEHNKNLQEEAESIRVHTVDITRNMHLLDMSIRSYALVSKHRFFVTMDSARNERKLIFKSLEEQLSHQGYPMEEFYSLQDSVVQYFAMVDTMKNYLIHNQREKFLKTLDEDPGYKVWLKYKKFYDHVYAFEDQIVQQAKSAYQQALRNSYWLQVILFLLTMPTLGYATYYAVHALRISEKLRKSEAENSRMLAEQKAELEQLVRMRTTEIQTQNEEITSQSEEILGHNELLVMQQKEIEMQHDELFVQNEKLREAQIIIEGQNNTIHKQNEVLILEVAKQTRDLKATNLELVEQNNRLEQFTYIISHNLRAPLARLLGLSQILDQAKGQKEVADIISMMVASTHDLDQVIKDLDFILQIQRVNTQLLSKVSLQNVFAKTVQRLERDIKKTKAQITIDVSKDIVLNSLPEYLDSIFYNLVNNAIKYRHPDRLPIITIKAMHEQEFVRIDIQDNGLGVDMSKYGSKLFTLYKRFHFHVEGKGLSLYLVKTQITTLGGKIEISSTVDEGTVFSVFLKK